MLPSVHVLLGQDFGMTLHSYRSFFAILLVFSLASAGLPFMACAKCFSTQVRKELLQQYGSLKIEPIR